MNIGIISYQMPHKKTLDIVSRLINKKRYQITIYAFPFKKKSKAKPDVFCDRPEQLIQYDVQKFCKQFNIKYTIMPGWNDSALKIWNNNPPDVFLHCTAKIIPPVFLKGHCILNCHPGLLPQNRGVDAFKWSIVNKWPIGSTLHQINEIIDSGTILKRQRVPIFESDTLKKICQRAYDYEIALLSDFERSLTNKKHQWTVNNKFPLSHQKIPKHIDDNIEDLFSSTKNIFIERSLDLSFHSHVSDNIRDDHEENK